MQTEKLVVLNPDGTASVVSIVVSPRGDISSLLADLAQSGPQLFRNVGLSGQRTPVSFVKRGPREYTVFAPLVGLRIETQFTSIGGDLVPVFQKASGTTHAVGHWTPPANMRLWLVVQVVFDPDNARYLCGNVFLLAVRQGGATHRLPLPNTFEEGRLCMGNDGVPPADTLFGAWEAANQVLQSAPWNGDLVRQAPPEKVRPLFTFTVGEGGSKSRPFPKDFKWDEHCFRVANTAYDSLPLNS